MVMNWLGVQPATQLTSISTIEYFSVKPRIEPGQVALIEVAVEFHASVTAGDGVITVEQSADGTNWAAADFSTFTIDEVVGATSFGIAYLEKLMHFRIGLARSGGSGVLVAGDLNVFIGVPG